MPQPYQDPIGGFTSGFAQGTQMGLLRRQQRQAELKQKEAVEAKRIDQGMKKLKMGVEMSKIKHPTYRKQGMTLINQALTEAGDMVGIDPSQLPDTLEWNDGYEPFMKELDTAFQAFGKNQDRGMLQRSIGETLFRAGDFIEEEKLKRLETTTEERKETAFGEQEAAGVQQALDIRGLQEDPRFQALTPEQQAQVGAPSAERGLLARGGATGQALLKEGAKPEKAATVSQQQAAAIDKANTQGTQALTDIETALVNKAISSGTMKVEVGPDGSVVLTQGTTGALAKPTVTAIEKDIIATQKTIGSLNEAENLFDESFLTTLGKGRAFIASQAEKLGYRTDTDFLADRTRWRNQAKSAFLAYRKHITGVAGGEKEFKEIAKAFPDPERNSPTEYLANLEQTRRWGRVLDLWLRETKETGLNLKDMGVSLTKTREIVEQQGTPITPAIKDIDNMTEEEAQAEIVKLKSLQQARGQ